ncbi:MAG: hypothetical protein P8099_14510 [Gemmatimonadota bacterium]
MAVRLVTLGTFRVLRDGAELSRLPSLPLQCALLVYLALERGAERTDVCRFFWPERDLRDANVRLDGVLRDLGRDLGDDWLRTSDGQLTVSDAVSIDALEYCEACRSGDVQWAQTLYRGPFLDRAKAAAGHAFAAWAAGWRERLEALHRAAGGEPQGLQLLIRRVVQRHVLPWTLAYLAGAWVVLEATNFMAGEFGWRFDPIPALTMVLSFGVLSTVTLAWFHGAAGMQRMTRQELAIHGMIAAALLGTFLAYPPGEARHAAAQPVYPLTRIAVLFFQDHSEAADLGPLGADLTESIVHRLANVPALDVLPMTAVEPFHTGQIPPLDSLVRLLRVGSFVEGSVTRHGDSIRITAQLVETSLGTHLDSWTYTEPAASASISEDMAGRVAEKLRVKLGSEMERRRIEAGTEVAAARAAYQQARLIVEEEAPSEWGADTRRGVALLDDADSVAAEAEALDPSWTAPILLRVRIADVRSRLMGGAGSRDRRVLEAGIEHASRALAIDPDDASALEWRGRLRYTLAQHSGTSEAEQLIRLAESDLRAALRMDAGRPHAWWALSQLMSHRGNFEGAYAFAMRAYQSDSFLDLTDQILDELMFSALNRGRFGDARHWVAEGRRLWPTDQLFVRDRLVILAALPHPDATDIDAAWANADTLAMLGFAERRAVWLAYGHFLTAIVLAGAGQADSADHVVRRSWPALLDASQSMHGSAYLFEAVVRYRLGAQDSAIALLRRHVEILPSRAETLATETWFRGLWDDPRYQALYSQPTETKPGR